MAWNNDDWCFFEYKLCQIKVEDGRVTEASDGMFRTRGYDLSENCKPLTLSNANISQHAEHWSNKIHENGLPGLNFPDIHRKLVELWVIACDAEKGRKAKTIGAIAEFANAVLTTCDSIGEVSEVHGIRLMRHRRSV